MYEAYGAFLECQAMEGVVRQALRPVKMLATESLGVLRSP